MENRAPRKFGIGIPNFGNTLERLSVREIASAIEGAGFDGIWLTDHLVVPSIISSRYPYSPDGKFFVPDDGSWFEAISLLAYIAAVTRYVELGIGVCVLPLRDPRILAQQIATIDRLSEGRVMVAGGAGWLAGEFETLEIPFKSRGDRLEACIEVMRLCWTGQLAAGSYGPYTVSQAALTNPTPAQVRPIILLAGESNRSLERIVRCADGWYGAYGGVRTADVHQVSQMRLRLAEMAEGRGRDPSTIIMALRIALPSRELGSAAVVDELLGLAVAGVSSFTIDFGWRSIADGRAALESLAEAVAEVRASFNE